MKNRRSLIISRRTTLIGASTAMASILVASPIHAVSRILQTPAQTEGPFYPEKWVGDIDNDLVIVKGEAAQAMGKVLHLDGTVTDLTGNPVPSAQIEIWQCDAKGVYHHSEDESPTRRHDKGFQGYGRTLTNNKGYYSFRTIKPVSYPGRTPHIHVKVIAPEKQDLTTQMYVYGEPQNASDFLLNDIRDKKLRNSLMVKLTAADRIEQNAMKGTFNIVLG